MNTRHIPTTGEFSDATADPPVVVNVQGVEPSFEAVGRPWRYEFPHQPSTSMPEVQPRFTVPLPEQPEVR